MKHITWPRLHTPEIRNWIAEFALMIDAAISVVTFSIVETNLFCAASDLLEPPDRPFVPDKLQCFKCGSNKFHFRCDKCGNLYSE